MLKRLVRRLKRVYVHLLRAPGAPKEVALGMAIGLFISLIPVMQTLIALGVVEVLRRTTGIRASRVAAAVGVWLTNPLTAAPIYALSLLIGRPIARLVLGALGLDGLVIGKEDSWLRDLGLVESSVAIGFGAIMLGTPIALIGYEITRRGVLTYQNRRMARQRDRALRAVGLDPATLAPPAERAAQ